MLEAIQVVTQKFADDCAIACLAMTLTKPYETIYEAIKPVTNKKSAKGGFTLKQIEALAAHFGVTLVRVRKYDLDEAVGILSISGKDYEHVVVVRKGTLIDPSDGTVWEAETYLATHGFKAHTLLTIQEPLATAA